MHVLSSTHCLLLDRDLVSHILGQNPQTHWLVALGYTPKGAFIIYFFRILFYFGSYETEPVVLELTLKAATEEKGELIVFPGV